MAKSKAKVLVVTSWAPPMIGGPQNFYNLFSQFPQNSYVILTGYRALVQGGISPKSWLAGEYVFYDRSQPVDRSVAAVEQPAEVASAQPQRPSLLYRLIQQFHRLPLFGPVAYAILSLGKTGLMVVAGLKAIRQHRPTTLLGISDHGPALIATGILSLLTKKPYQLYLFDIYKGNNFFSIDKVLAFCLEGWLVRRAERVIVTNEGTEAYYLERYGKQINIAVIHNAVFGDAYQDKRTDYQPKPPYTILYTGHVYWAQEQSVNNLIAAMAQLSDLPIQLDLYVPGADESLRRLVADRSNIRLLSAAQSEMPAIQSQATLLFLPLSWHTKSPDIIRTATPGKFTDYLAAGRPMLVHAPNYAYISQYVKQTQLGVVVDVDSADELAAAIRQFLANPSTGKVMVENALKIFEAQHDAVKNAKKLQQLLGLER